MPWRESSERQCFVSLFTCLNLDVRGRRNHQDLILTLGSVHLFLVCPERPPPLQACDAGRDLNDGSSPGRTHTLMTSLCVSYKAAVFLRILLFVLRQDMAVSPGCFKYIPAISSLLLSVGSIGLYHSFLCSALGFKFVFCLTH